MSIIKSNKIVISNKSALLAGWLLVAGSIIAWIGAFSPMLLMPREDFASNEALLRFAATHPIGFFIRDGGFLVGLVITVLGFTALTTYFRSAGKHVISELALVSYILGAVFWMMHLGFRLTETLVASREMIATGFVPAYFNTAPLAGFFSFMFGVYWVLSYVSIGLYGVAILSTQMLPAWLGWLTIILSIFLALTAIGGDTLPLLIHALPFVLAVALLRRTKPI